MNFKSLLLVKVYIRSPIILRISHLSQTHRSRVIPPCWQQCVLVTMKRHFPNVWTWVHASMCWSHRTEEASAFYGTKHVGPRSPCTGEQQAHLHTHTLTRLEVEGDEHSTRTCARAHTHTPRTVALLLWKCGWTELLFPFTEQPYTHTQLNTPATATATLRLKSKCVQQGAAATTGCALCT
jgi:hypothetical protein